MYELLLE